MTVRVRFAPAPTGHLHLGSLRTALFNYLFARHAGGKFLLRIEDTDRERSKDEYTQSILEALSWCDITPDEPPVIQSARLERHRELAEKLVREKKAYRCYCTPEELEARLGKNAAEGDGYSKYDKKCRNIADIVHKPYAIRFAIPEHISEIICTDAVRGDVVFPVDQFDDFIIVRSDGYPMYNFVVVVDDADMGITHIIRGEEHLINTPRQQLLYQALEFTVPIFAHLTLILGPDGRKLSKREAATDVVLYKKAGYLPDALCSYLARLGWAHGDQEIFTREELIKLFSLEGINKKGAIFDTQKLQWVNAVFMRQLSGKQMLDVVLRDVDPQFVSKTENFSEEQRAALAVLYAERVHTLEEVARELIALSHDPRNFESAKEPVRRELLEQFMRDLRQENTLTRENVERIVKNIVAGAEAKLPALALPVRIALTGKTSSPSVFDLVVILGVEIVCRRIQHYVHIA